MSSFGGFIGTNMSSTTNIAQPHLLCPLIPMPTPNSPSMSFTLQSKMENGGLTDREFDPNIMGKLKEEGCDSRSGGDNFEGASGDDLEAVAADDEKGPRRRKKYHRHTTQQIQELEAFFKECPHPDEKQRLELSRKLSLGTKQVKFWFQNRRTQMKTQMERHENVILKQENDRLRLENIAIKDAIRNPICNNCGGPAAIGDISYEDHHLRIENARLKDELNRISAIADRFLGRPISLLSNHIPPLGPNSGLELAVGRNGFGNLSSMNTALSMGVDLRDGTLSAASSFMPLTSQATSLPLLEMPLERSMSFELAVAAMDELAKKALINNPLWIRSMDEEKEILNREEYMRTFTPCIGMKPGNFVTDATRETTMVNVNSLALVETLMDVDRWAEMFPCLIARAFITDVISPGMNGTRNGTLQLMHAELQVLSPLVPARLVRFLRFSKQHADGVWTVVDVSIDSIQEGSNAYTFSNCRRLPSGCVVQDMPNGCSKVTWVEHSEYDESAVPAIYRQLLSSGMGYGAQRWVATLQRQCECLEILMSSAVPLGTGLTPTGRNNLLKLAQRMVDNFCSGICGSSTSKWEKLQAVNLGEDVRVMTWKSLDEPGDPSGVVLSAATSVSLPVTMQRLFDFLRDESMRSEWDILSTGGPMQEVTHISKGQYHGNGVSLLRATTTSTNQSSMLILQETWTDASGSLIVYAPVNISAMSSVMNGGDSAYVALLPSGFAIVPGGPLVKEIEGSDLGGGGGSLLTVGFQILVNNLPSSKLTMESVETVKNLISCTIQKIKAALRCT